MLAGNFCRNIGNLGLQIQQSQHSSPAIFPISVCKLLFSAGNLGYILGNLGNICILCNVGRQSPSHSRAAIWAISTLSQPRKSRHSWLAISAKSTSLAMSGNTLGDLRNFAKVAISGDTLRNICILGYLLFGDTRAISAFSSISAISASNFCRNLGLQVGHSWHSQQAQKSRHSWLAISAISTSSTISGDVLGYMGTFAMVGNLRRNLGLKFWQFPHSQQPGKTAILAGSLGNIDKLSNVN